MGRVSFQNRQPIEVTVFGDQDVTGAGTILAAQDSRMMLRLGLSAMPGDLLKIEWDKYLALGEVIALDPADSSKVYARIAHALLNTARGGRQEDPIAGGPGC